MRIRIRTNLFTFMRIRILFLIKVIMSVHGPPSRHYFEPPKLLDFDCNGDPDPAFHSNADLDLDPDTASKNNADACGSGSATLEKDIHLTPNLALFLSLRLL